MIVPGLVVEQVGKRGRRRHAYGPGLDPFDGCRSDALLDMLVHLVSEAMSEEEQQRRTFSLLEPSTFSLLEARTFSLLEPIVGNPAR